METEGSMGKLWVAASHGGHGLMASGRHGADEHAPPGLRILIFQNSKPARNWKFKIDALIYLKNSENLHETVFESYENVCKLGQLQIPDRIHAIIVGTDSNLNIL
jgi:hypothetical protein